MAVIKGNFPWHDSSNVLTDEELTEMENRIEDIETILEEDKYLNIVEICLLSDERDNLILQIQESFDHLINIKGIF